MTNAIFTSMQCEMRTFSSMILFAVLFLFCMKPELTSVGGESHLESTKTSLALSCFLVLYLVSRFKRLGNLFFILKYISPFLFIFVGYILIRYFDDVIVGPSIGRAGIFFYLAIWLELLLCTKQACIAFNDFQMRFKQMIQCNIFD